VTTETAQQIPRSKSVDGGALLRHRPFLLYSCAYGFSEFSHMIAAVAIGWQFYALTDSAFDLGMV